MVFNSRSRIRERKRRETYRRPIGCMVNAVGVWMRYAGAISIRGGMVSDASSCESVAVIHV